MQRTDFRLRSSVPRVTSPDLNAALNLAVVAELSADLLAVGIDVDCVFAHLNMHFGGLPVCELSIHGAAGAVVVAVAGVAVHYQQTTRVAIEPNAWDALAVAAAVAAGGKVDDVAPAAGSAPGRDIEG